MRLLAGVVLLLALDPCFAAEDGLRVLLLADTRPVLVRLQVHIDGKPFRTAWQHYLEKLFVDLDRDGDGLLSQAELARAPEAGFLASFLQGNLNVEAGGNVARFEDFDPERDGVVGLKHFLAYYRRCGLDRVKVVLGSDREQSDALTDALFLLLDLDRDGKLSKEELRKASATLHRIDLDEDEWITPEELLLHRRVLSGKEKRTTLDSLGFLPIEGKMLPEAQARVIRQRYQNKVKPDDVLSRPVEKELLVRLGTESKEEPAIEFLKDGMALEVHTTKSGAGRIRGLHAFYRQQFEAVDADQRGFIERKQLDETSPLLILFALADRNGDGRLTNTELDAFLKLHALGAESFVTLTVTDQSLGLFDILDADHDGRLSLRELHTAWDRLRPLDRDGDGKLSRAEFPRRLQVRLSRGTPPPRPSGTARPIPQPLNPRGPAWFRKMDRNGDGYVSRREFLGSEELFKKLDTDVDGLISPEEAERLDTLPKPDKRAP